MGKTIRDAMTSTPRIVIDRDIVTRVVVEGKEDGHLVGILAQANDRPAGRTDIRRGGD
jgi:hypothetical protein